MLILIFGISAFFTAIISAVTGMGGGVALLTIMTFFQPISVVVPLHGAAQLVSNSTRTFYLRNHIKREFFLPFAIGAPLGTAFAVYFLVKIISPQILQAGLAAMILFAVFRPKKLPSLKLPAPYFFFIGICAGICGTLIGATGPFLAPFFLREDFNKEEIIATKSSLQLFTHFLKIPAFLYLGFSYWEYFPIIICLAAAVVLGTLVGIKLLKRLNEDLFRKIFKTVLTIAAFRLLYSAFIKG